MERDLRSVNSALPQETRKKKSKINPASRKKHEIIKIEVEINEI